MPEATVYAFEKQNNKAYKANEEAFKDEHNRRVKEIERRWNYYNGEHDLPLKKQQDGYNDSVIVNHVEALADRLTAFLIGDGLKFDAAGENEGEQTAEDEAIEALLEANRGDLLIDSLASAGAIEGHNCVRIEPREGEVKLTRIKQANFTAFWDPFDMSRVLWYRLQHIAGGAGKRIDYVRGAIDQSLEVNPEADGWAEVVYTMPKENVWKLEKITPWDYPFPPLVDWQNLPNPGGYYGKNDVMGAIRLNDALNFILSNTQRIVKHYAAPKTIGIGFNAGDVIATEVGGLFTVNKPRSEVDVFNLELQSDGALVQWLASVIQSGLWESGGMIDPANMKDMVGQLTNFGLRILFVNAIKRTDKKRLLYAEGFEAMIQRALEVGGAAVPDSVVTIWPDVLPEDEATIGTLMQEWQGGVISLQTYRKLRGYDHAQEEKRLQEEAPPVLEIAQVTNATQPDASAPENLESTKGLNGAQLGAVMDVLARMQEGALPAPASVELLVTAGIDRPTAEKIVTLAQKAEVTITTPVGNRPPAGRGVNENSGGI